MSVKSNLSCSVLRSIDCIRGYLWLSCRDWHKIRRAARGLASYEFGSPTFTMPEKVFVRREFYDFFLSSLPNKTFGSRQDSISDDKRVFSIVCLLGTFICLFSQFTRHFMGLLLYDKLPFLCCENNTEIVLLLFRCYLDLPTKIACFVCTRESQTVDARNILVPTKYNYMKSFLYLTFRPVCVHSYNIFLQSFSLLPTC